MKLILIPGSPYARKIRVVMAELEIACELEMLSSYPPTETEVGAVSPALRVPVLLDGEEAIFESDLIIDYLLDIHEDNRPPTDGKRPFLARAWRPDAQWRDRKRGAMINTLTDTLVNVAYLNWCGLAESRRNLMGFDLADRWNMRVARCLDWLEAEATPEGFVPGCLTVQDIALVCALEWTDARMRYPWRDRYPTLQALHATFAERPSFVESRLPPMPEFLMPALEEIEPAKD